jgi:hypothetical protein
LIQPQNFGVPTVVHVRGARAEVDPIKLDDVPRMIRARFDYQLDVAVVSALATGLSQLRACGKRPVEPVAEAAAVSW